MSYIEKYEQLCIKSGIVVMRYCIYKYSTTVVIVVNDNR